jgi:hypothetical protein
MIKDSQPIVSCLTARGRRRAPGRADTVAGGKCGGWQVSAGE